jgi:hypothetical protein
MSFAMMGLPMTMTPIVAALYLLCMLFLLAFGGYILLQSPYARTNRLFAWLSLSLFGWVGTLFVFSLLVSPTPLLWVGRANFAAMVFVVPLTYLFTRAVAGRPVLRSLALWIWIEIWLMAALTMLTPWIDRLETITAAGVHFTSYGVLFPVYVLHLLVFFCLTLYIAFSHRIKVSHQRRIQLTTLGVGIVATALVSLVTNLLLPYIFGNFVFINIGTLSTILFLAAAGTAVFVEHLFRLHIVIRATFIFGGLIALLLESYNLVLGFLARLLPLGDSAERGFAATGFVLVVSAFTQQPIREWLGRLLSGRRRVAQRAMHGRDVPPA